MLLSKALTDDGFTSLPKNCVLNIVCLDESGIYFS